MFTPRDQNPTLAACLILCATAFIAATTLFAKALGTDALGPPLHPFQISFGRFFFAFLAVGTVVAALRPSFSHIHIGLHVGRTSFGWIGVTLMFASVAYIPLADATAISFLNPVFTMILAIPMLGEKVGRVRWTAACIALSGAMILLRPTPDSFQPAALMALAAAMIMGLEVVFIKKLTKVEAPLQILFINNGLGAVIATVAVIAVWQSPTAQQWLALICTGVAMVCAQACFVNGMARAEASFVAPFSYATLVFAAVYDLAWFAVRPDGVTYLGAGVIMAGAALLAWREARVKPSTDSPS